MSRRKRHPSKKASRSLPNGYPTPEERQAIIERRNQLFQDVIYLLVRNHFAGDPEFQRLELQYGKEEVGRQLGLISQCSAEHEFLINEPFQYRKYRQLFARFGGTRCFLGRVEFESLVFEHATTMARRKFMTPDPVPAPGKRERELFDLLLVDSDAWEDITPPAIPPCPDDFHVEKPATYTGPEQELLTWGWKPDLPRVRALAKDSEPWQPVLPMLLRMVFDKGLLNGWPGEPASWAPYHALHLLGVLQATSAADRLLTLVDQENDWLSDRLPVVWALMGSGVEPTLWNLLADRAYVDDARGLVVAGLQKLAINYRERRNPIVQGLIKALQDSSADDATVNAYIVFVLDRLKARQSKAAIAKAFEQNKVDTSIIEADSVNFE